MIFTLPVFVLGEIRKRELEEREREKREHLARLVKGEIGKRETKMVGPTILSISAKQ